MDLGLKLDPGSTSGRFSRRIGSSANSAQGIGKLVNAADVANTRDRKKITGFPRADRVVNPHK
jgi:hypothetical protein